MKYLSLVSCFVGILIHSFILAFCYEKISFEKLGNFKKTKFYYVMIFLLTMFIYLINLYINFKFKIFVIVVVMLIFYKVLYKESILNTFFKTIIIYLFLMIGDFFVSMLTMFIPNIKSIGIDYISFIKDACTVLDSIFMYLIFKNQNFTQLISKLINYLFSKLKYFVFVLLFFAFSSFWIIAYKNAFDLSITTFLMAFCLIVFFILLCIAMIYQYFKNKTAEKEQKQLDGRI